MKPTTKAALTSALIFPGAGHFLLGRAARGCLFLLPTALAALYLVNQIIERAQAIAYDILSGKLAPDPGLILERVAAASSGDGPVMRGAVALVLLCWAGSIIDTFVIGDRPRAP